MLEKDLILEEVGTLTNRLKKQTIEGRQESNEVTVKLTELGKRIKEVTRSMMSKVSELSMHQALAMNLFQEKSDKEALIESIKTRLKSGDIPVELFERDLIRAEKMKQWRDRQLKDTKEKTEKDDHGRYVE